MENNLPNTINDFFENKETEYRYFSQESMDNYWSMNWFIKYLGLEDFIDFHDGTQVVFKHPDFDYKLQVDAGGLGDFYSHNFVVTLI